MRLKLQAKLVRFGFSRKVYRYVEEYICFKHAMQVTTINDTDERIAGIKIEVDDFGDSGSCIQDEFDTRCAMCNNESEF